MSKRRKRSVPNMLFWNRRDQQRFIEAVERLCSAVNDLERILAPAKRRRAAKERPLETAEGVGGANGGAP
jgi:hypothetical protein